MSTKHDALRRLADDLAARRVGRRDFVRSAAALGVSLPITAAILRVVGPDETEATVIDQRSTVHDEPRAQSNKLVVSSWGGNYGEAQRAAQFEPFTKETGIEITLAPQSPELPLIEAQVTSGKVEWDLAENSNLGAFTLAGKGMLEKIDYTRMDSKIINGVDASVKGDYSVGFFFWSSLLSYNTTFFNDNKYPASWADFWNVSAFDAPRGLTEMNFEPPPLEVAPLAKGVAPDKLYPLDIPGAFKILDEIRPHITKWLGTGADGTQLLAQGELGIATSGNGAMTNAIKDGAPLGMEWNQGLLYFDAWVIPKGAPNVDNAYRFIEFCLRPDVQANFVKAYPIGAVASAAYDSIPQDVAASSAGSPDNLAKQVKVSTTWWTTKNSDGKTNLETVYDTWAKWIIA